MLKLQQTEEHCVNKLMNNHPLTCSPVHGQLTVQQHSKVSLSLHAHIDTSSWRMPFVLIQQWIHQQCMVHKLHDKINTIVTGTYSPRSAWLQGFYPSIRVSHTS